ncbi:AB hydrolase-1 domain-containing protein [Sphingomonas antarctica]|uniref:alpha/beta hydrolase family protein n=1 Tax=Sphingomonas antarctica TaxID=2040274 RepID=UPI0039E73CED
MLRSLAAILLIFATPALAAVDPAIFTDPPRDAQHPARMEVLHIPSGGVNINGLAYIAAGAGPHPVMVLCHGLPGNEKNLDLAQAVRRAGWTVITFNYRGSWGSPGIYRFAHDLEDADAVLAYIRAPANTKALNIDPQRVALAGHSLGGWVTAMVAARHPELRGAALISASSLNMIGRLHRDSATQVFAENGVEALAGTSPRAMAVEVIAAGDQFDFVAGAEALSAMPVLIVTSDDGLATMSAPLATAIGKFGKGRLHTVHLATDHSYSDARIALADLLIGWLKALPR